MSLDTDSDLPNDKVVRQLRAAAEILPDAKYTELRQEIFELVRKKLLESLKEPAK